MSPSLRAENCCGTRGRHWMGRFLAERDDALSSRVPGSHVHRPCFRL